MRCLECAFYQPANANDGECRASPPVSFMVPVNSLQGQGLGFASRFPQVSSDAWCGAFEQHEEEEDGKSVVMNSAQ